MKLVENARLWWRKWSSWAAAFNSALLTTLIAKSGMLFSFAAFLPFVPGHWRGFTAGMLAALTALLAFIVPVVIAQIKQPKLECKPDA